VGGTAYKPMGILNLVRWKQMGGASKMLEF
jgi:hypothetical protein